MGRICIATVRLNYSTTNVTTSAYVTLIDPLPESANRITVYDSSNSAMKIAVGPAGSEHDETVSPPGGSEEINQLFSKGQRISLKALDADATAGELIVSFYR